MSKYEKFIFSDFEYVKKDLENPQDDDIRYLPVDYNRLRELLAKHRKAAFELAILSGAIDRTTGELKEDYTQDNTQDYFEWAVLEVVELSSTFGLAGSTIPYFTSVISEILKKHPVTPLTGLTWEWVDIDGSLFNRREPSIFKKPLDIGAYWTGGKAFSKDGGKSWYTNKDSNVPVTFPCAFRHLKTERIVLEDDNDG